MTESFTILLLEDEPIILMDLEFAAADHGCRTFSASNPRMALDIIDREADAIDVAILDVSLGDTDTCLPVARKLDEVGIPFVLHSADFERHGVALGSLGAERIAKPAPSGRVVEIALSYIDRKNDGDMRLAAE